MENDNFFEEEYIKEDKTINAVWANAFGIIVIIFAILLFVIPFYLLWSKKYVDGYQIFNFAISIPFLYYVINIIFYLLVFILIVIIHEIIHGIFVSIFAENGFKSIKYGILSAKKLFTPYCHCEDKLRINHYRIVIIMPTVIMGIIPSIISIIIGNIILLFWGIICIISGCGDILLILILLKEKKDCWIFDYPTEIGYSIYRKIK